MKLSDFKKVFEQIGNGQDPCELVPEQGLIERVYLNIASESGLTMNQISRAYGEALTELQKIEKLPKKKKQVQLPKQDLQRGQTLNEIQESKSNIQVKAKLNNFQIWIPLQAKNLNSQIMNLSFISDFSYMKVMDLTG